MKIKINQVLTGIDGQNAIIENGKPLTLKDIVISAVLTPMQDDDQKRKFEKWDLFKKVRDSQTEDINFTSEEIVLIKAGIGKIHPPLIMGQTFEMMEGENL
jgi:hypothetical protein